MRPHNGGDRRQIVILYVPPIFPQVHGDAVRAGLLGDDDGFSRLRITGATRLTQRRDMIDIHAEVYWIVGHVVYFQVGPASAHCIATSAFALFGAALVEFDQDLSALELATTKVIVDKLTHEAPG